MDWRRRVCNQTSNWRNCGSNPEVFTEGLCILAVARVHDFSEMVQRFELLLVRSSFLQHVSESRKHDQADHNAVPAQDDCTRRSDVLLLLVDVSTVLK